MVDLVASIDGGGTKTLAAIADQSGDAQIFPSSGGCNPVDNSKWAKGLKDSIDHLEPFLPRIKYIAFGLPGFSEIPEHDEEFQSVTASLGPIPRSLSNDVEIAHIGAFAGQDGVLILAGTGSMGMVGKSGEFSRRGGWGHTFGDEGSGFWIGRRALSIASQMFDGRMNPTPFASGITSAIGLASDSGAPDLLAWVNRQSHSRSAIAALARTVNLLAIQGDQIAISLLHDAAAELFAHFGGQAPHSWSFAGSVFQSQILREELTRLLGKPPQLPILPPLGGGLLLAANQAGWNTGSNWVTTLTSIVKG